MDNDKRIKIIKQSLKEIVKYLESLQRQIDIINRRLKLTEDYLMDKD